MILTEVYREMFAITAIIIPFFVLFALEFIVLYCFFRKAQPLHMIILLVLLVNLFTWPLGNYLYALSRTFPVLFLLEAIVIGVESIFIWKIFNASYRKAILSSFLANLASCVLGAVLIHFESVYELFRWFQEFVEH